MQIIRNGFSTILEDQEFQRLSEHEGWPVSYQGAVSVPDSHAHLFVIRKDAHYYNWVQPTLSVSEGTLLVEAAGFVYLLENSATDFAAVCEWLGIHSKVRLFASRNEYESFAANFDDHLDNLENTTDDDDYDESSQAARKAALIQSRDNPIIKSELRAVVLSGLLVFDSDTLLSLENVPAVDSNVLVRFVAGCGKHAVNSSETVKVEDFAIGWTKKLGARLHKDLKNYQTDLMKLRKQELELSSKIGQINLLIKANAVVTRASIIDTIGQLQTSSDINSLEFSDAAFLVRTNPLHCDVDGTNRYLGVYEFKVDANAAVSVRNTTLHASNIHGCIHPHSYEITGAVCLGTYFQAIQSAVMAGNTEVLVFTLLAMFGHYDKDEAAASDHKKYFPPFDPEAKYTAGRWNDILKDGGVR